MPPCVTRSSSSSNVSISCAGEWTIFQWLFWFFFSLPWVRHPIDHTHTNFVFFSGTGSDISVWQSLFLKIYIFLAFFYQKVQNRSKQVRLGLEQVGDTQWRRHLLFVPFWISLEKRKHMMRLTLTRVNRIMIIPLLWHDFWILCTPKISKQYLLLDPAEKFWNSTKRTYSRKVNVVQIFEIWNKFHDTKQDESTSLIIISS